MIDRALALFAWIKSPAGKGALFVGLAGVFVLHLAVDRLKIETGADWLHALHRALDIALWAMLALALIALIASRVLAKRDE